MPVWIYQAGEIGLDVVSRLPSTLFDRMKTHLPTLKLFILAPPLLSVLLGSCTWCMNEVGGSSSRPVEEAECEIEEAVVNRKQKTIRKNYFLLFVSKPVPRKFLFMPQVLPPKGHRLSNGNLAPLIT